MKKLLNTLYVTRDGTRLCKDGECVSVMSHSERLLRVPLHNLEAIQSFGWNIAATPQLLAACAEQGIAVSQCNPYGKLLYRVSGFSSGNVLLRRQQYRLADSTEQSLLLARHCIVAKILNARNVCMRARRDNYAAVNGIPEPMVYAERVLAACAKSANSAESSMDLLGVEGQAAEAYFRAFPCFLTVSGFSFTKRTRRPPKDPVNALLSFAYCLLSNDCRSALEAVGLDAAVGFYHQDRPGRPSLALDLMEELRAPLADRLVLTLLNRRQIVEDDFSCDSEGSVSLSDKARKIVITHWQERKTTPILHPFLDERISVGHIPHIQARLLAQYIRGALDAYPPFFWK